MRLKIHSNKGYTLIEAIAAFLLTSGVIAAVTAQLLFSFRMSKKAHEEGKVIANAQLAFNYLKKKMFDLDNVYLDMEMSGEDEIVNTQKVFLRHSYLPEEGAFDGTFNSLKSRWGCFWFRPQDDESKDLKEMKFFQSQEVPYHQDTGLTWMPSITIRELNNVTFEYANKQMKITLEYKQGERDISRCMIFYYDKVQKVPDRLADEEEPTWPL